MNNLVHGELRRALLRRAAFVELRHEAVPARDHLGLTRGDVIAKQTRREPVFPRRQEDPVERGYVLDVPAAAEGVAVGVVTAGFFVGVPVDVGDAKVVEGPEGPDFLHEPRVVRGLWGVDQCGELLTLTAYPAY